jgi:hypothetical protein
MVPSHLQLQLLAERIVQRFFFGHTRQREKGSPEKISATPFRGRSAGILCDRDTVSHVSNTMLATMPSKFFNTSPVPASKA